MMTRSAVVLAVAGVCFVMPNLSTAQVALDPGSHTVTVTKTQPIRSARRAFAAIIPEVRIKEQPLGKVLDKLRDVSGSNINIDWKALEAAGVTKDSVISTSLTEISLGDALGLVIQEAGPKTPVLTYIDMNVIQITTQAVADTKLITRTYDVHDLTGADISQILPQGSLGNTVQNNRNQNTQGSSTGGINYAGTNNTNNQTNQNNQQNNNKNNNNNNSNNNQNNQSVSQQVLAAQKQSGADLVSLVKTSIRPDIWKDDKAGGGPATVVFYNGLLVVTAPIYIQEAIGGPVPGH